MQIVGPRIAAIVLLSNIVCGSVAAQPYTVRIGVIEQLSGLFGSRAQQFINVYKKNADAVNAGGGLLIGDTRYKIELVVKDSGGNPAQAHSAAVQLIVEGKAVSLLCHTNICITPAEEYAIPTILTAPAFKLGESKKKFVFLINAPGANDSITQAELAYRALQHAIANSGRPSAEQITMALRRLDLTTDFGKVRFDELGNNVGLVRFTFRPGSRPDAAGCSSSCGTSCPSNCGQTPCGQDGSNQCCNICGRPIPQ